MKKFTRLLSVLIVVMLVTGCGRQGASDGQGDVSGLQGGASQMTGTEDARDGESVQPREPDGNGTGEEDPGGQGEETSEPGEEDSDGQGKETPEPGEEDPDGQGETSEPGEEDPDGQGEETPEPGEEDPDGQGEASEPGEEDSDRQGETPETGEGEDGEEEWLDEDGVYSTKEEVALYLHLYGHLPSNYITKKDAEKLGWPGGSLEPYAPGMCIGGSRFGNYEGLLPKKDGRVYTECDIDTLGADKRGAKRIVFSNDGLIYYTEDHYQSFELLYGEE